MPGHKCRLNNETYKLKNNVQDNVGHTELQKRAGFVAVSSVKINLRDDFYFFSLAKRKLCKNWKASQKCVKSISTLMSRHRYDLTTLSSRHLGHDIHVANLLLRKVSFVISINLKCAQIKGPK